MDTEVETQYDSFRIAKLRIYNECELMFPQFNFVSQSFELKECQFFMTGNVETGTYKLHLIINHNGKAIFGDGVK